MTSEKYAVENSDLVSKVIQNIHGSSCKLLDYEVEKGTESIQGAMSDVLRVIARVEGGFDGKR